MPEPYGSAGPAAGAPKALLAVSPTVPPPVPPPMGAVPPAPAQGAVSARGRRCGASAITVAFCAEPPGFVTFLTSDPRGLGAGNFLGLRLLPWAGQVTAMGVTVTGVTTMGVGQQPSPLTAAEPRGAGAVSRRCSPGAALFRVFCSLCPLFSARPAAAGSPRGAGAAPGTLASEPTCPKLHLVHKGDPVPWTQLEKVLHVLGLFLATANASAGLLRTPNTRGFARNSSVCACLLSPSSITWVLVSKELLKGF